MEELEVFLAGHCDIERAAVLIGECGPERIEEIFRYTNLKECCVVCPWPRRDIETLEERIRNDGARGLFAAPEELRFRPYYEFSGMEGQWALCPILCEGSDVLPFLERKPAYVAGSIKDTGISAFNIWERCRDFCREISLKTWREGKGSLMLDWAVPGSPAVSGSGAVPDSNSVSGVAVFDSSSVSDGAGISDSSPAGSSGIELSVVVPVYNVAPYVERCIESITAWKAEYVEFLFVNDGSTDESADIIQKWMAVDERILLIEKENGGCASARQAGLDRARGRYVGFIDPDDFVDENMYRKLLKAAMCGNFDISLCGYNEYYENSGRIKPAEDSLWHPYLDGCYDREKIRELITYCRVAIWRGIYKREFLERNRIGFYTEIRRFDDLPFKVETFAMAGSVVMIPEYLYYYRLEREGQDVAADDERLYVHFAIFKRLDASIGKTGNQFLIDNLQMCKIQTHRYALSKIREEFRERYVEQARADLNSLCGFRRTCKMAYIMLGSGAADAYKKIMQG